MSSGSSSPYQSQVFKFFSHQSRRLSQKLVGAFRNLQLATKSRAEALLYPLYKSLQPDQAVGKRLKAAGAMHPSVDDHTPMELPIVKVLELVRSLPSGATWESENLQNVKSRSLRQHPAKEVTLGSTLQSQIPKIEAIAVNLSSRHLVLVGEDNRIFDVLTPTQQKYVANSIEEQISNNNYYNNYTKAGTKATVNAKENKLLKSITTYITNIVHKFKSGVPVSGVSQLTNSNQDAGKREDVDITRTLSPGLMGKNERELGTLVDLGPLTGVFSYSQVLASKCLIFLDTMLVRLEPQAQLQADVPIAPGSNNILVLIKSIIGYIFETRQITLIGEETAPIIDRVDREFNASTKVGFYPRQEPIQASNSQEDCWLRWEDLFGSDFTKDDWHQNLQTQSYSKKYQTQESDLKLGREENKYPYHHYQFKPDWIEIKATFIGYEKHPLEHILTWLDHLMLWIEIIFTNIFYFCKGLLQLD